VLPWPGARDFAFGQLAPFGRQGRLTRSFNVKQLSPDQRELVASLTKRLAAIRGIKAITLGGSHARGHA
jgi:hypothetical protein